MKNLVAITMLTLFSVQTFAATVHSAKIDKSGKKLLVDVSYAGGCKKHVFELEVGGCLESFPVQCSAQLIDKTKDDFCEALVYQTISISLESSGLTDRYYAGASLTILGDLNYETNKASEASVVLPLR